MMTTQQLPDLPAVSYAFPDPPRPEIRRENLLETIRHMFSKASLSDLSYVMLLEGPPGIGKTTLAQQFACQAPHTTFSLFLRSCNRAAHSPDILQRDLCHQLSIALGYIPEDDRAPETGDERILHRLLYDLKRRAKKDRTLYSFVVDGFDELEPDQAFVIPLILDMLPLGWPEFRFLISNPSNGIPKSIQNIGYKTFPIPGFILDESRRFLSDLIADQLIIDDVHYACSGIPGLLAGARRMIANGELAETVAATLPSSIPDLFALEWSKIDLSDEQTAYLLAVLAHDQRCHTIESLARVSGYEPNEVAQKVRACGCLSISDGGQVVTFVSAAFRKSAAERLAQMRDIVTERVVSYLLSEPCSEDTLRYLPEYLRASGRLEELLQYLSAEHVKAMLQSTQSWFLVTQQTETGVAAARALERDAELCRFGIQGATIGELQSVTACEAQLEAYLSFDRTEAGIALAQSATLKEDRLYLLACVAKYFQRNGQHCPQQLHDHISKLYSEVDKKALKGRAESLAHILIYSHPDLALDLVQGDAVERSSGDVDWSLARLSILASLSNTKASDNENVVDELRSSIRNPKARAFAVAVQLMLSEYSANEVIGLVNQLESSSDKLYYCRGH